MIDRRLLLQALLALAAGAAMPARAEEGELERLFAQFAAKGERRKAFVERRYSVLFRNPPELRGTLTFRPPALLEREVLAPRREKVRIDGDAVTLRTREKDGSVTERKVSLAVVPQLAELVVAIRAILAGDLVALRRLYVLELKQPPPHWRIALLPRESPVAEPGSMAASVQSIEIAGEAGEVQRIELKETTGDRTEIVLSALQ